ncbi:Rtr1/RPAP2 family-domain-containing protein [Xylariaceae sp. FL0255]|nr:Rtr1/RPAP2 family-domain-containing protein [Xylariaceae sp. FL0255]
MATDIAENKSKGILKRPTPAKDEDSRKAHDIATQHARIIHSRHEVEDLISETLITLSKYPFTRTPSHSASNPAPSDALAFKDGVRLFQPSDYEDLIEERNANGLCGYTLCPNPKSKMTHGGTFKLVNYGRKDFNIVPSKELERWCSQKCAKRAMYVKVQLNETAAWERAGVASIGIDLLEEEEGAEAKEITPLGGNPPYMLAKREDPFLIEAEIKRAQNARDLALERGDSWQNSSNNQPKRSIKLAIREKPVTARPEEPSFSAGAQNHLITEGYKSTFDPESGAVNLRRADKTEGEELTTK